MEELLSLDKESWRRWLAAKHDRAAEAWLTIRRQGAAGTGLPYEEAVVEALCFGWIDGRMHRVDAERYALRFSPRKPGSIWSRLNRERAEAQIRAGRMTPAGLARIEEAKQNGWWEKAYDSRSKPRPPADLEAALQSAGPAWEGFNNLTNSQQLQYIYWVESAKREETRGKRIAEVVDRLAPARALHPAGHAR